MRKYINEIDEKFVVAFAKHVLITKFNVEKFNVLTKTNGEYQIEFLMPETFEYKKLYINNFEAYIPVNDYIAHSAGKMWRKAMSTKFGEEYINDYAKFQQLKKVYGKQIIKQRLELEKEQQKGE